VYYRLLQGSNSQQTPAPSAVTKTSDLAKVQVRVDEYSKRHWLRISNLAGLNEPFSEGEMARLSEQSDPKKRGSLENDKKKKIKVDELGEFRQHAVSILRIKFNFIDCGSLSILRDIPTKMPCNFL
jgi:hypothetical protein